MRNQTQFQAARGTRDLFSPDIQLWNYVEETARHVFSSFGYGEIRPPIFELTRLFARGMGDDTDVVSKEMFDIEVPLADMRSYIEGIATPGTPRESDIYLILFFKFCEDALGKFKSGGIPNTVKNSELLTEFAQRHGSIHGELYREIPSGISDLPKYLRDLVFALDLDDELSLRPEATASVCRAYIEHNMQQWPQPVKLYYIGPMFRRERPQKGRYRQFYQIGAEVLEVVRRGVAKDAPKELAKDAAVDAELIEMLMTFFERIGLQGAELSVNSIGHAADNCRRGYVAKLGEELTKVKDQLGADSQRRIKTNPMRVLDSKLEHEQAVIAKLPRIADHLCDECTTHYAELKRQLDLRGVTYKENWRLVRGLDYYMRTTFEITARGLGSQDAVCGGGRYDGLVELLGGPPTKGIGFAIGEDRVILSLQEQKAQAVVATHEPVSVYIAWLGEKAFATALRAAKSLRTNGIRVEMPATELKFGKALERASKLNARFALILGDDEVASGQWTLKTLADGSQQKLTEAALLEYLRR